jgi:hypothetical protein
MAGWKEGEVYWRRGGAWEREMRSELGEIACELELDLDLELEWEWEWGDVGCEWDWGWKREARQLRGRRWGSEGGVGGKVD